MNSASSAHVTETPNAVDTLGGKIQSAREARKYSISELSRKVGVNPDTLANWERDRSEPRANKLMVLAGVLNVSPLWLMGTSSDPMNDNGADDVEETASIHQKIDRLEGLQAQTARLLDELRVDIERLQSDIDETTEDA